jgi:hypothetical protein
MVLPLSTCKSGPPKIVAVGTGKHRKKNIRQKVICAMNPRIECNKTKGKPKEKREQIYVDFYQFSLENVNKVVDLVSFRQMMLEICAKFSIQTASQREGYSK